jgi:hypothetical protein
MSVFGRRHRKTVDTRSSRPPCVWHSVRGPKQHPTREPAGCSEDWADWWTNFRREGWAI